MQANRDPYIINLGTVVNYNCVPEYGENDLSFTGYLSDGPSVSYSSDNFKDLSAIVKKAYQKALDGCPVFLRSTYSPIMVPKNAMELDIKNYSDITTEEITFPLLCVSEDFQFNTDVYTCVLDACAAYIDNHDGEVPEVYFKFPYEHSIDSVWSLQSVDVSEVYSATLTSGTCNASFSIENNEIKPVYNYPVTTPFMFAELIGFSEKRLVFSPDWYGYGNHSYSVVFNAVDESNFGVDIINFFYHEEEE